MVRDHGREESDGSHDFCEADFEQVVGLFEAVQSSNNFYPLTCEWVRQVVGKTHDNLLASGGRAGKALVEEGTGDVEVFVDESVDGIGGLCIGVIGRQSTFPCDMV